MKIIENSGPYGLEFILESRIVFEKEIKPQKPFNVSLFIEIDKETDELFIKINFTPEDKQAAALSIVFPDYLTTSALPLTPVNAASFVDIKYTPEETFCRIIAALLASEALLTIGLNQNNEIYFLFQIRDFATEARIKLDDIKHLFEYQEVEENDIELEVD